MTTVTVVAPGPMATIQDLGRSGYAHVGVPASGAADRAAMMLANRLVGNREGAATIEATLGGLRIRTDEPLLVSVTGAGTNVTVGDIPIGVNAAVTLRPDAELIVGAPEWGCRNYVAVRGGFDVPGVLSSRSTDTLSGLGPPPLAAGTTLPVGADTDQWPAITDAPTDNRHAAVQTLEVTPGPRASYVAAPQALVDGEWTVSADSNRVGVRLLRPEGADAPLLLHRDNAGELPSEGVAHGSVQVPPTGRPILFLADHPVTGGYPVIAVLTPASIGAAAQLTAGCRVRFRIR